METIETVCQFRNSSYLFIPFRYNGNNAYRSLVDQLNNHTGWQLAHDKNLYMLKYVADKFDSKNPERCQCFHFVHKKAGEEALYATTPHFFQNTETRFTFLLKQIHLYCFSTGVGILAFEMQFTENDPMWIATAEYYLKKVSREKVVPLDKNGDPLVGKEATLLDLTKELTADFAKTLPLDFFFYANPSTERANTLTYLDVPEQEDYAKELYYLRRCYSEDFVYNKNPEAEQQEIYRAAREITWGISPEAAICLARPAGHESFVHDVFFKNFNQQYVFMYVFLLHQKYVLFMMLTQLGIGTYNNLEVLEEHQKRLYEFENDFVFSRVTEVPQYQNLYHRLSEAFALKAMFADVREPLAALSELRKTANERKQQERDNALDRSLFMLSLLTFFSALMDSFNFADSFFSWFCPEGAIKWIQGASMMLVFVVFVYVIKNLISSRKK
ncbi:MAG: hypothetical protein II997_00135 [Clostridia bacterium]|nr:hypothetical protein [Clostridia bacterium]